MRVLLAQNMRYRPGHGGATKSNRIWLEQLAAAGHRCVAVTPGDADAVRVDNGVEVHTVSTGARLAPAVVAVAAAERPDWTLVPSDDPGLVMLGTALRATPGRVVYLLHTLQQAPFGPRSFYPGGSGAALVRRCAAVVAVSRTAQEYAARWAGLDATLIHPDVYGSGPHPRLGRPDAGAVTLVNPCGIKGLDVLLGLADAEPDVPFLAVPTWGTDAAERAELARRPNIALARPVDDIADLLARTRVLLMPSLWDETFGYTAVEAMLHGVPVLAADVGGLREAKLGVPHLLPVRTIEAYRPQRADEPYPRPVVPPQDVTPWRTALRRLLDDPAGYTALADQGRRAAAEFVAGLDARALERCLAGLTPAPARPATAPDPVRQRALAALLARRKVTT
ncbi:glycosyltransferase family 4 protein [Cryptosporangium arvum]|uniref:Glycosyltransferase n=1 Tax=Cryptosporangium arvum DSM 44712 TaxID=927661 RepID=A0A010Z5X9_9ACTN|nr:glycosyltransferase family 4 protein [Cryptosporangium arvum]EXG82723.1 glycosyltransferase [Cryptosporangium arvum DSM 44712]